MKQLELINIDQSDNNNLLTIEEASRWATQYLNKQVTKSQISYLISYGRIDSKKMNGKNHISMIQLKTYYDNKINQDLNRFAKGLSKDVNMSLSFSEYNESERTKHVHRLHPYKGKFIPQLVEYFIDEHTDNYKKDIFFHPNDLILDPFAGSGTTLVQAGEQGIHSIGIELSVYNSIISKVKLEKYNMNSIHQYGEIILECLKNIENENVLFNNKLDQLIIEYNLKYFPTPHYRKSVHSGEVDEKSFGTEVLFQFNKDYSKLLKDFNYKVQIESSETFIEKWFTKTIQQEIKAIQNIIKTIEDTQVKNLFMVILGRTVRSCRATKHIDLATLIHPQYTPYYCERKHFKICRPVDSLSMHFLKYYKDTIKRISVYNNHRTEAQNLVLLGSSNKINLAENTEYKQFLKHINKKYIDGIFTSPPYVGQIDYHDQHQYAYEIFNLPVKKDQEIGILGNGKGKLARESYSSEIIMVFKNLKPYLKSNANCFIVANDKFNLYPEIIKQSGFKLIDEFKRPVLNRVEKDRQVYEESIFHVIPD